MKMIRFRTPDSFAIVQFLAGFLFFTHVIFNEMIFHLAELLKTCYLLRVKVHAKFEKNLLLCNLCIVGNFF